MSRYRRFCSPCPQVSLSPPIGKAHAVIDYERNGLGHILAGLVLGSPDRLRREFRGHWQCASPSSCSTIAVNLFFIARRPESIPQP